MSGKRRQIPRNIGVWNLVKSKREWSTPVDAGATGVGYKGWHERGYSPHCDAPGLIQFVTFRIIDSFPLQLRSEWEHLLQIEDDAKRRRALEDYLDRGHGSCWLRDGRAADLMEGCLLHHHGVHYDLRAWVVMPNHVHVLFQPLDRPMGATIRGWKTWTARETNKQLYSSGALWAEDFWDTYMRDPEHELRVQRYIEDNPVKPGLVLDPTAWRWSSARRRDVYGRLVL